MHIHVLGADREVKDCLAVRLAHQTGWERGKDYYQPTQHPGDLTEEQWRAIEPLFPQHHEGGKGRPRKTTLRAQVNGMLWMLRHDSSLRDLPADFGPWGTAHFRIFSWAKDGTLAKVLAVLNEPGLLEAARRRIKVFKD